jgi:hypothetical protein
MRARHVSTRSRLVVASLCSALAASSNVRNGIPHQRKKKALFFEKKKQNLLRGCR